MAVGKVRMLSRKTPDQDGKRDLQSGSGDDEDEVIKPSGSRGLQTTSSDYDYGVPVSLMARSGWLRLQRGEKVP